MAYSGVPIWANSGVPTPLLTLHCYMLISGAPAATPLIFGTYQWRTTWVRHSYIIGGVPAGTPLIYSTGCADIGGVPSMYATDDVFVAYWLVRH